VLAALSVLRSNALGTGASALQAFVGAVIGFGIASLVMTTMGGDDTWLWIILPIVTFFAAYTPGAVNYVVGQAGFTVFVVVLFNIFVPEGWRTGLVRVQDIAIGAGITVAVGALLWPRGARTVARRQFAELLRVGARRLGLALDVTLRDAPGDLDASAVEVADAHSRAVAALEDLALEHGGGHVDRQGWGTVLVDVLLLDIAAAGIIRRAPDRHPLGCGDALEALGDEGEAVVHAIEREADGLARGGIDAPPAEASAPVPVPAAVTRCLGTQGPETLHGALGLVWVHEWISLVAEHDR
jgi:uncharacterized membrane protein YccC